MKDTHVTPTKQKVALGDMIANWAVGRFVGFYFVYRWLGTDEARVTLVEASNIKYFAVFKAVILLCAMGSAVLCGVKIISIAASLRKTIKIVDIDEDPTKPAT